MASIVESIPAHHQLSFSRQSGPAPLSTLPQAPAGPITVQQLPDHKDASLDRPRQMSFSMGGGYGTPTGLMPASRSFTDSNMHAASQQQYQAHKVSSIYTAQYSGVAVYEMEVNSIAVMRRRSDAWLNATQILKVAGVDKGKRTKVLEKEILSGEHEKVQGGYGKYQGTWISYKRGREFCRAYGVEEILRPLLEYDMGADGQIGNGAVETPTKEQALAAARKKMMLNGMDNRPAQTPNGTFFKNISASAANAIQAINKARYDHPSSRPGSSNKRPSNVRTSSQNLGNSQDFPGSSQQSIQSMHSEGSFGINGQAEPFPGSQHSSFYSKAYRLASGLDNEPPRKRIKQSSQGHFSFVANGEVDDPMGEATPTEPNDSFVYHHFAATDQDPAVAGVRPLPQPNSISMTSKRDKLLSLFMDPNQTDFTSFGFELLNGEDLDTPIDSTAHTALHWGATLARPSLIRMLVNRGANIFRVNYGGETALMRAVQTTNNHEQSSFTELLELLGPTIETRDDRGRTVLHHIAISSSIKGKSPACRYYLESLLEFVVRNGSSQDASQGDSHNKPRSIGLGKFMSEIVNAQDMAGDTALNIAARNYSRGVVQQLLEVGANPSIANTGGFKPLDFGVGGDSGGETQATEPIKSPVPTEPTSSQKTVTVSRVADTSRELVSSISTLISDTESSFRSELQAKQSLIDQAQSQLRDATIALQHEQRALAELEEKSVSRQLTELRVSNLRTTNDANRSHLATTGPPARQDVSLGDADAGLVYDLSEMPEPSNNGDAGTMDLTPDQEAFLDALPSAAILEARARAYATHNRALDEKTKALRGRSFALEKKLRTLIALSTGVADEARVDAMLGPLRDAVESERGEEVDYLRLREFLRKIS